jgi:TRAP-type C4-dicarboxylate transport system permease small subunit
VTTLLNRLGVSCLAVAGIAVLAMMLIGGTDVVTTIFGLPIPGAVELIQVLMVLVIFLALPEVELRRQHIAIDLVSERMPLSVRRAFALLGNVLSLCFYGGMAWQAWKLFWSSWSIREYATGLVAFPLYPAKGLFALGLTVVGIAALANLLKLPGPQAQAAQKDSEAIEREGL